LVTFPPILLEPEGDDRINGTSATDEIEPSDALPA
jgi:hypothetical protein